MYKEAKKESKVAVAKAQSNATVALYEDLETPEGAQRIFKLASARKNLSKDITAPKFINDDNGKLITNDALITKRWHEYYSVLLNEKYPRTSNATEKPIYGPIEAITNEEVSQAIKRMKKGKSVGPDNIPVEFWSACGSFGVEFLTILFNKILNGEPMPTNFRQSILIPFFKNKGDS